MLLASCTYEEARQYRGKLVVADDESKKPEEVLLNIVTDEPDRVLSEGMGSAYCLTTSVSPKVCPEKYRGRVFHEVGVEDFTGIDDIEGVITLVRLPEGYSDMRKIDDMNICSEGYEEGKLRFIGGNLLEIPGIHIGRSDKGKEKMSAVFNGVYDSFIEVCLKDIEVKEIMSKVRSSGRKSSSPKKAPARNRKLVVMEKFFGTEEEDF